MSEVKRLTKADIIAGKDNVHYEYFDELDGELPLRSLTEGQWAQVEAIKARGSTMKGMPSIGKDGNPDMEKSQLGIEIDMEKMSLAEFEADCLAVFFGVADDNHWTVEDVKRMQPPGAVKKIAAKIYQITGVKSKYAKAVERAKNKQAEEGDKAEQVEPFRKE